MDEDLVVCVSSGAFLLFSQKKLAKLTEQTTGPEVCSRTAAVLQVEGLQGAAVSAASPVGHS